jgi:hypothetical protein
MCSATRHVRFVPIADMPSAPGLASAEKLSLADIAASLFP